MPDSNPHEVLRLAIYAGEIMLKNGAETYRVEDTIMRILTAYGATEPEAFSTTTGVFAGINNPACGYVTAFRRVKDRAINLDKVARVNELSRRISAGGLAVEESCAELERIDAAKPYRPSLRILAAGVGCFSSCFMFGGSVRDCFGAFLTCMVFYTVLLKLNSARVSVFLGNIISGGIIAALCLLIRQIGVGQNLDLMIIGSIMPLVPGVGITNAVRDFIEGDYLSGSNRVVEAVMTAVAIAIGVGVGLVCSMAIGVAI